ncbi:MAG TPA: hypothetical protein VH397_16365 [Xanthobacteraceae bacterium]
MTEMIAMHGSPERAIDNDLEIVPLAQWLQLRNRDINHYDGRGKFMREGTFMTDASFDDVFGDVPAGATHVAWFNRWRNAHPTQLPAQTTRKMKGSTIAGGNIA